MTEKRSFHRVTPTIALEVYNQSSGELIGYVKNISQKGTQIESITPLFQGVELNIRVNIPGYPDGRNQFIFKGVCVWWIKNPGNGAYNCGIEIKSITSSDRSLLKSAINDLCI